MTHARSIALRRLSRRDRARLDHREEEARLEEQLGVPLASDKRRVEVRFNQAAETRSERSDSDWRSWWRDWLHGRPQ